jgi:hypothetical protein
LFPERLLIGLAPAEVTVGKDSVACDPAFGAEPWQGAISALKSLEFKRPCNVTVVLSNHFVRYAIVPWSNALRLSSIPSRIAFRKAARRD